jgi:hypothetical protein
MKRVVKGKEKIGFGSCCNWPFENRIDNTAQYDIGRL